MVGPLEEGGVAARLLVAGQVGGDQPLELEAVGQLRRQHRVVQLLGHHPLDVVVGAHLVGDAVVAGDAPTDDDPAQVALAADLLARVVQPPRQAVAAELGVDHDLDPVHGIAVGIVVADVAVVRDLFPVLPLGVEVVIDDQARRRRDDVAVVLDADLPLGEIFELALEMLALPRQHAREAGQLQLDQGVEVADLEPPQPQPLADDPARRRDALGRGRAAGGRRGFAARFEAHARTMVTAPRCLSSRARAPRQRRHRQRGDRGDRDQHDERGSVAAPRLHPADRAS